jgi:flavin-dependent dehydrogenase
MNEFDYVILGGGVAGLCAAKRLLELGVRPLIIEAGSYPAHKVCGEFISPSSLPILNQWNIHPIPIYNIQLNTASKSLQLKFPQPAGSLSHLTFDLQLATQISQQGATLYTQTKVLDCTPPICEGRCHEISLSSGEVIKAKHVFIAAGRLPGYSVKKPQVRYIGLKAHFSNLNLDSTLHMFSFKGAYLGLAPIENGNANLACLATIEQVRQFPSSQHFMQNIIESHPLLCNLLASGLNLFDSWMEAPIPEFGMLSTPDWPHTYWIGDAAGTIPPASGNGLSLAIASGYLAAEFAIKERPLAFKHAWQKRCASQIRFAKSLHRLFLSPSWGSKAISLNQYFPLLAQKIFEFTRDPGLM